MDQSTVFPAFIRATFDDSAGGFPAFERAATDTISRTKRQFETNFADIQRTVTQALSMPRNAGGSLDLGAGQLQASARAAEARAIAAREIAVATRAAAEAEQDYSQKARLAVAAAEAVAKEEEAAAASIRAHVVALDQLQTALNRSASGTQDIVHQTGRGTTANYLNAESAKASRFAYIQLGQQLQDVAIQAQLGVNPLIILTQQGSQAAFALSGLGKNADGTQSRLGRFAGFLAGPWGAAIFGAVTVVSLLTEAFSKNADGADQATLATSALGDAQSAMGEIFGKTSSKIAEQNELLRINARIMAINLRAQAAQDAKDASAVINRTGDGYLYEVPGSGAAGLLGRALGLTQGNAAARAIGARARAAGQIADSADRQRALDQIIRDSEKVDFKGSGINGAQFREALSKAASARANERIAELTDKSLNDNAVNPLLSRADRSRARRPNVDHSAERFENANEQALAKIADINRAWDEQPKLIDRAANSAEDLVRIIKDADEKLKVGKLTTGQRDELEKTKQAAREAAATISEGLNRPYNDLIQSQQDALSVQRLTTEGRYEEAEALQQILRLQRDGVPVDEARAQAILDNVAALRQAQREQQRLNEIQGYYLNALGEIRGGLREAFASGKPGSIFSSFGRAFKNLSADLTVEKLFGPIFRQMEDQITGAGKVRKANEAFAGQLNDLSTKSTRLGSETDKVTLAFERLRKTLDTINGVQPADVASAPANDNPPDIIVTGRKVRRTPDPFLDQNLPGPIAFFGSFLHRTLEQFFGPASPIVTKFDGVAKFFANTEGGAALGGLAGTLAFGGGKNTAIGSSIGGALGQKAGEALAKGAFGKALGSLSGALGPLGSIAGGLLGGALGSVLSSTPKGSATIGGGANGGLVITGYSGNSESRKKAAGEGAQSSISSIEKIAEALGGEVTGNGTVSIGIRKGSYRVDTTGQGITKTKKGAIDFGEDAEAAVKFATLDLIKDGVIAGLRASTQRILQQGKDLDSALEKAVDFESVFKRLKAYKDPVGAALDTLDAEFKHLKGIFAEAGADASEYAQLEELYGIERAKAIKEAGEAVTASLRSLLDDLTVGNDARSLRERKGIAQAAYDPLAARVAAGDTTAYDDYAAAARQLLDIERQISGSTKDYFDLLDQITGLTGKAVQDQTNIDSISASRPGLFDTNTSAPVVSAVDQQTQLLAGILNGQLTAVNDNLGTLIRMGMSGNSTSSSFVFDSYVQNF